MLGRLSFDAMNYANSIYDGTKISTIATQENINRFLAKADKATLAEVGTALDREIDALTREKIPEYKKLTVPEQEAVRETMRRARANGASENVQIFPTSKEKTSALMLIGLMW